MEEDFQDDEEQEQSQQAQSESNLNDGSFEQDNDQNLNNQLAEVSKDKKQIKRVCIIPIKKEWKSERQIFFAFSILSIFVLVVICGIVLGNMNIAAYLIGQSAQKETEQIIQNTLENSVQSCKNLYKEVFVRYSISLQIISRLFLSSLNLDVSLYDSAYSQFPIKGQNKYVSIKQDVTDLTSEDKELSKYYQGNPVSLNYISYFSLKDYNDLTKLSKQAETYLEGADVLNYFLKNMIHNQKALTRIQQLYISISNEISVFYPAGSCKKLLQFEGNSNIKITDRPWYSKSIQNYQKTQQVNYVLTGPYDDLTTGLLCITLSQVIVSKNKEILGVIGLDILSNDLNSIIPISKLYNNGKFYFASITDGVVLNDPCEIRVKDPYNPDIPYYKVDSTEITGFTTENWQLIKDQSYSDQQYFKIQIANGKSVIIYRLFISISDGDQSLVIFATIPNDEGFEEYEQIQITLDSEYRMKQYYVIIIAASITAFSLLCSYQIIRSIVSPLQQLADYTKELTHSEKKNNSSEMRKKKTFDDIKTSDSDIEQLINAFKKLINVLTGFKKGTRKDKSSQDDDSVEYPRGDCQMTEFYKQTKFLSDYDEFEEKIRYYIDLMQKFTIVIKQNQENNTQDMYEASQSETQNQSQIYQKIETSFLNFIDIVLNCFQQSINEQFRKGQVPQFGQEEIQSYKLMQNFFFYLIECHKNLIVYDKYRSSLNQEQDEQEYNQDHVEEEEYSNLPEEALYMYEYKASQQRLEDLIIKFKKIDNTTFKQIKSNTDKRNTSFINEILPKDIIE